jgi:dipeptidase
MCDTLFIPAGHTQSGNPLLAKNSDREPTEAQALLHVPRQRQNAPAVRCTFIEVAQAPETYEAVMSKPFHIWGAEMGVNEFGVAIGNEAVFTKVKMKKDNRGLTGMDLLRLALERSQSAQEAVTWVTRLLEQYGQDACGGYKNRNFFYHNSFLIADVNEAFVLETAGREWALEAVRAPRSISNRLSIDEGTFSAGARAAARQRRWWRKERPFSFQRAYADFLYSRIAKARRRQACTTQAALRLNGNANALDAMRILQTHERPDPHFKPGRATTASVCMHATGLLNPSSTTGSMVAELRKDSTSTIWLTGTPHPCLSVYIPFFLRTTACSLVQQPTAQPDHSLWWQAEMLHRWIARDYQPRKQLIDRERQELQSDFFTREQQLIAAKANAGQLDQFSRDCIRRVEQFIQRHRAVAS